jgi:hypothetical protein
LWCFFSTLCLWWSLTRMYMSFLQPFNQWCWILDCWMFVLCPWLYLPILFADQLTNVAF